MYEKYSYGHILIYQSENDVLEREANHLGEKIEEMPKWFSPSKLIQNSNSNKKGNEVEKKKKGKNQGVTVSQQHLMLLLDFYLHGL